MSGHDGKNLCPKCFIEELNHVVAKNSGDDPVAKKSIMDQPTDSQQPKPTAPGTLPEPPAGTPTGEEPTPPEPVTPTPGVDTPVSEGEEEPAEEGGEPPVGGETPPVPPVA